MVAAVAITAISAGNPTPPVAYPRKPPVGAHVGKSDISRALVRVGWDTFPASSLTNTLTIRVTLAMQPRLPK